MGGAWYVTRKEVCSGTDRELSLIHIFGYGLLGHIDNGGTIEIGRVQVGPSQWKTALINLQLSGRLVFFKTISKQHYETRSDVRAVSGDLFTLLDPLAIVAYGFALII